MNKTVKPKQLDLADQGLPTDPFVVTDLPFVEQLEPTPTEKRKMLIAGCEDFYSKYPPGPSEVRSAEEAVDNAIAKRLVSLAPGTSSILSAPGPADFDWVDNADCVILKEQPATAIYHGKGGHIVIRQTNGLDDDVTILVTPENANAFMDGIAAFLRK